MIPITNGMPVPDAPGFVVAMDDGQYGDNDLIACVATGELEPVTASYAAQFIKYGKIVYQFNDPVELGEAIIAIDDHSTHDAAQLYREERARKLARSTGTLVPENQVPAPDATDPTPEYESVPAPDPDPNSLPENVNVEAPFVENPVIDPLPAGDIPESDVPATIPEIPSDTTPVPTLDELPASSNTVPLDAAVDISTTTPE